MKVTIYHNPRCSTSRRALALLRSRGIEPEIVEYLKTPPSAVELTRILALLGKGPREILRRKEPAFAAEGLDDAGLTDAEVVAAMVRSPVLIERPIVVAGERAALGRPPEAVLGIL